MLYIVSVKYFLKIISVECFLKIIKTRIFLFLLWLTFTTCWFVFSKGATI